jgi:two-component system, chemotaxis family, chemotaxis protein CheY
MSVRVLLVDDLPFIRSLLTDILKDAGMRVVAEADNGRTALKRYLVSQPDVVLLDIAMPVMDGIATLKRLRQMDDRARVIMCSALGEQAMIVRAIQLGARDFVVKPFKAERVVSAIRKVLESDGLLEMPEQDAR